MNYRLSLVISLAYLATLSLGQGLGAEMPHGSYKVGFRQQWHYDYGRTYRMDRKGSPPYGLKKSPRPILMNLWYPAPGSTKGKAMPRSEYLNFVVGPPSLTAWQMSFRNYNREIICKEVIQTGIQYLSRELQKKFEQFMESDTACIKGAPAAKGKFPLIIYHQGNGSSVEDNSEFCEYMASWGFVVVNSSYLAAHGETFNIDSRTGSGDDIRFLTAYLRNQPNVDWTKIGFIGHSGGAHTALKFRSVPGTGVDAIISLDTTQDYHSLLDPRWAFIKNDILPNLYQMGGPILMVADNYATFELADKFTNADRTYFTIGLDHNEFISQGVQVRQVMALTTPEKRAQALERRNRIEKSYGRLCVFARHYFEEKLLGKSEELQKLKAIYKAVVPGGDLPYVEDVPKGPVRIPEFTGPVGSAPTPRQVRPLLLKEGVSKTVEVIKAGYRKDNPAPIYQPTFIYSLQYELLKTGKAEDAKALHAGFNDIGLKYADMFVNQAWFGEITHNYGFAEECLVMLLTLEPNHAEGKTNLAAIRKKMGK